MQEEERRRKIKQRLLDLSADAIGNIFNTSVGINKLHKAISAGFFLFVFFCVCVVVSPTAAEHVFGINASAVR